MLCYVYMYMYVYVYVCAFASSERVGPLFSPSIALWHLVRAS